VRVLRPPSLSTLRSERRSCAEGDGAGKACLRKAAERDDFRVVHFSIQRTHLHQHLLITEADRS
jgi:hypothetical protein